MSEVNKKDKKPALTIKINGDNTGIMKSLCEIEEKVDKILEKVNQLKTLLNECNDL